LNRKAKSIFVVLIFYTKTLELFAPQVCFRDLEGFTFNYQTFKHRISYLVAKDFKENKTLFLDVLVNRIFRVFPPKQK